MAQRYTRKYPRIPADFTVQILLNNQTYRERASAMGGGGLFLSVQELPMPTLGTELTIQFRPAKHLPIIKVKVKVCYAVEGEGIAVEFLEIDPEHRRLLLQFIHNKMGNRRKHPRAHLATQIECEESMSLAFARDISVGGMFIETSDPMPVGSRLTLRFNLEENEPIVEVTAEVTYPVGRMGVGVQFLEVKPEDLQRIDHYVAKTQAMAKASPSAETETEE